MTGGGASRPRPPLLSILLSISAAMACAGSAEGPAGDAPAPIVLDGWRRAEHQGFTIYTDAADATAQRAFRRLDRFTDYVSQVVFRRPLEVHQPIEVFVFGSREEYLRFAPELLSGHTRREEGETQIALSLEQTFEGTGTLYHELVHTVLYNDPDRQFPSWFHEGLAVLLSTSVLRDDVLTVGKLPPAMLYKIHLEPPLPLRRLLASPAYAQRDPWLFYADAFAFVHFGLLSGSVRGPDHAESFGNFVTSVSLGEAWEPAFVAAFGASPEDVAIEYERYRTQLLGKQVVTLRNVVLESEDPPLVFEPVGRLEMARQLAQLASDGFEIGTGSQAFLYDQLLAADANDWPAVTGRIRVAVQQDDLELGDRLWEGLPEDQRDGADAWLAEADLSLARARRLRRDGDAALAAEKVAHAITAYRLAAAEAPDRLSALTGLGKALLLDEHADPAAGIAALEHAIEINPEVPEARLDLAELLIRGDASSQAIPHLDYVIEAYPSSDFADRAKRLRRKAR